MKVLVSGSRNWVEQKPIEEELRKFPPGTIVVQGGSRGVDNIAAFVAKEVLGLPTRTYPANWDLFGRSAGTLRNQQMLDQEHPDRNGKHIDTLLVWHEDPKLGKGTRDMVKRARKANPPINIQIWIKGRQPR